MDQIGFYFDQTRCTGCYTCAIACKDWYDLQASSLNYLRVKGIERGKFPDVFVAYLTLPCFHCIDPACAKTCPVDAITKTQSDGSVVVNHKKCVGKDECGMICYKACPWGAPQFGLEKNAKMQKCELCRERLAHGRKPICVEACPMYALDVNPLDKLQKKYGKFIEAEGFQYHNKLKPSVTFKPKKYSQ
jgi:anaerobic dimethyl sulfoxide reductase subunit B (iron-sulfur subunit)